MNTKRCPKCGNLMKEQQKVQTLIEVKVVREKDKVKIVPFCCETCNYIELYVSN